ncbi:MAG: S41 family peptidase [Alphaproteobacteria bacterium]
MRNFVAAAGLAAFLLLSPMPATAQENGSDTYRQLNLFGDVFEHVRSKYVEEVSDQDLIEAAISGMLTSLDPHSSYLDAKSYQNMQIQTKGEFGGLGIQVTMENGLVKVISPIDDTPAYRAGIKPGDLITHLDDEPVLGLTLEQAVERMRGLVDTDIRLTIRRDDMEPFDLSITRAIIKIQMVRWRLEGDIGYIRIPTFNEQTEGGIENAVQAIKDDLGDRRLQGFILDMRNNPGGLLEQAVAVSDTFLDKGEIVSTRGRNKDNYQRFNAQSGDLAEGLPIVVLINSGSASASEIVAGALKDHRRAIILGTRSFGKGSVQTIFPLPGHGAIRLTTALYFTPSGSSIQAKGIDPDIVVEQARIEALDEDRFRREEDLRGALLNGEGEEAGPEGAVPTDEGPPTATEDFQLIRALDLLRGLALFSATAAN